MKYFEWDENKRKINLDKHGIDFVDAINVFADINRIEFESKREGETIPFATEYAIIDAVK